MHKVDEAELVLHDELVGDVLLKVGKCLNNEEFLFELVFI